MSLQNQTPHTTHQTPNPILATQENAVVSIAHKSFENRSVATRSFECGSLQAKCLPTVKALFGSFLCLKKNNTVTQHQTLHTNNQTPNTKPHSCNAGKHCRKHSAQKLREQELCDAKFWVRFAASEMPTDSKGLFGSPALSLSKGGPSKMNKHMSLQNQTPNTTLNTKH